MATDAAVRIRPIARAFGRIWRAAIWYARGVTGEAKYDAYLAHERAAHPGREPMTEREFWRDHYRRQDRDPGSRCC